MCWFVCVDVCGWKSGSPLFSSFPLRSSRMKRRSQPTAMWVDVSERTHVRRCASATHMRVCVCFLPHSHAASSEVCIKTCRALMRAEGRRSRGEAAAELKACSGGRSVGSVHSVGVCVSAGRVCAAVGMRGAEPELAGWVMNLLLRHSLRRNYTHQSQQGPPRPLTCSSNKRLSTKRKRNTRWLRCLSHTATPQRPAATAVLLFFCLSLP